MLRLQTDSFLRTLTMGGKGSRTIIRTTITSTTKQLHSKWRRFKLFHRSLHLYISSWLFKYELYSIVIFHISCLHSSLRYFFVICSVLRVAQIFSCFFPCNPMCTIQKIVKLDGCSMCDFWLFGTFYLYSFIENVLNTCECVCSSFLCCWKSWCCGCCSAAHFILLANIFHS